MEPVRGELPRGSPRGGDTGAALTKSETLTFGPGSVKTYFGQKVGLHPLKIDTKNTFVVIVRLYVLARH